MTLTLTCKRRGVVCVKKTRPAKAWGGNPSAMKREAGGLGEFLLCPQGKAANPRFMGVIVLGDVC